MDSIEHVIRVEWRHRVLFTDGVFDLENDALKDLLSAPGGDRPCKALVVLDRSLAAARPGLRPAITRYFAVHREDVSLVTEPLVCPGGEEAKNSWDHVFELHSAIDRFGLDRHSFLVAVGGGALLDVAGFAAATAHRGLRHIRIPSTTLSQCDSGVGLKNAINACHKKNFVGTFSPPYAVVNDFELLSTLPPDAKRAGYAEAVKVASIRDAGFFGFLEDQTSALKAFEPHGMRHLIRRCAELHLNHIAEGGDPFELGSFRPLDFGHWAGHKLEQVSNYRLGHGQAVAVGIALDVVYSRLMNYLQPGDADRVLRLLEALGFNLFAPELLQTDGDARLSILGGLEDFRQHLGGRLTVTLLKAIGQGFEVHQMEPLWIARAIEELQSRDSARRTRGL